MISETDIGDYEIIKGGVLGTGAFATVWKGKSKKGGKLVAIKAIKKKNFLKSQQLLSKEITILKELSSLHHRNVVGLLDCVELKDDVCLVMEYCNGGDLADCLHRNGTLSEDTLCSYVKQIAEAMKALQQKGIVHRDLKPQNILLCFEGTKYPHPSQMLLKIADFGFARFICGAEMATTLCGSPMYMAPEVIMSVKYSAKADLWSIGTILYQCLTGRAPFQAQNPQELKKKYEKSPGLKPNIPSSTSPDLRDLLMRMLKRDADERIDFEQFFSHPFLQQALPAKVPSKPVSVPRRRSSSSSESSTPGKSPGRSPLRSSPINKTRGSPSRSPKQQKYMAVKKKEEEMTNTLTATAGFTKVDKNDAKPTPPHTGRSTPEDFVMVPETICIESDGDESLTITKAPLAEAEMESLGTLSSHSSPHRSPKPSPKAVRVHPNETVAYTKEKVAEQSNPSRPVTLPMTITPRQSEPISVPSETKTAVVLSSNDGANMAVKRKIKSPDHKMETEIPDRAMVARRNSESRSSGMDACDAGSFSPPAVQFCIGTPPNPGGGPSWKRSSVVTPPPYTTNSQGSPRRKNSLPSPHLSPMIISNSSSVAGSQPIVTLPPILGSPNKMPTMFHLGSPHDNSPEPIHAPFSTAAGAHMYHASNTVPDNLMAMARQREAGGEMQLKEYHKISTESSLLSQQLHNQNRQNISRERTFSGSSNRDSQIMRSVERGEGSPGTGSRPNSICMNQQPTSTSSVLRFVPQPLSEETLMDDNHNETLGKLTFVLDLVECILDLARTLGSAFRSIDALEAKKVEHLSSEHYTQYRSSQRSLEQLVLYARACHLLNSALHMAREELRNDRLHQSTNLRNVLSEMNSYYHHVVDKCKSIHKEFSHSCKTPLTQKLVMATADKLIYNQAIQMCQTAALDEFSKNPTPEVISEVVRRYQVAQILLHSLAQTAHNDNDKHMLVKYRKSVESRLSILTDSGQFDRHLRPNTVDNQMYHLQT